MNGWIITYVTMLSGLLILAGVFLFAYRPISLRIGSFFKRKKGYLLVTILCKDRTKDIELCKFEGGKVNSKKRGTFGITKSHIHLDNVYMIPSVVVSEQIGTSIDPSKSDKDQIALTPKLVEQLIMEAILGAVGEKLLKLIQIGYIIVGVVLFVLLIQCGIIFLLIRSAGNAGIRIGL